MAITKLNFGAYPAGTVLQTVHTSTGALDTTTTTVPYDDTIMQITEGKEFMTLNITPKFSASKLLIKAQIHISPSTDSLPTMGLFVGTTANALATTFLHTAGGANFPKVMTLEHFMTAGKYVFRFLNCVKTLKFLENSKFHTILQYLKYRFQKFNFCKTFNSHNILKFQTILRFLKCDIFK